MGKESIFSWAEKENTDGKMVHVNDVANGLNCNCICPNCHEELLARHGKVNEHGFAHRSNTRGANLEICYMVVLYKLAEQIIQTEKKIHIPSYYGIYKEADIEFTDVRINGQYEREDKQPDIIAITSDNQQYLIEFIFKYKVRHKKDVDYQNLICLEIDISNQTLETLKEFLLSSGEDRRWINHEDYFNKIEDTYRNAKKKIKIVPEVGCRQCELKYSCCAVMKSSACETPIVIENNGQKYRLCKTEQYTKMLEACEQERLRKKQETVANRLFLPMGKDRNAIQTKQYDTVCDVSEESCFNCANNLSWANKDGLANCGCCDRLHISRRITPDRAKTCKMFKRKS